ncbi:phospholipase D-like domain-containing anti-phage protein [Methylotuvimicrobium sp.]|uniref:phospholipase D-like domain-containing anti-phage protein n=1 Tax=Methylotuvimicrobium sp. TaxID=2822413 RepID=UPI003D64DDDA
MITRHSSRENLLQESFLNQRLQNAQSYDRIAGYFRSSIFEVAGEALDTVTGTIRVVCNSDLNPDDVLTAKVAQQALRKSWCAGSPELLPEANRGRFFKLYEYLISGKLQVRVLPDATFGLIHGKAGVITLSDGSKTCFLGSINESLTAWKLNYELLWEDNSIDAINWVQREFDTLWNHYHAVPLSDFVIADIKRIAERETVSSTQWQEKPAPEQAIIETPVYRKELGLWPHQKFFVQRAFADHQNGGARYILADQVGLGKTVQLALAGMLMAMTGTKPVLVLAPKPLLWQWQDELLELLEIPSAIWTGKNWVDEQGIVWPSTGPESITKCPRKLGIVSQGLITSGSSIADLLLSIQYECVIVDEAHRSRRRKVNDKSVEEKAEPNNLMAFLLKMGFRTKSLLLATATPVQLHPIEAFDLLTVLAQGNDQVLGDAWSPWRNAENTVPLVMGETEFQNSEALAWEWIRNPLPNEREHASFRLLRRRLNLRPSDYIAPSEAYNQLSGPDKTQIRRVLGNYGREFNPFILHIIRRTRAYLESTIDTTTGEPYLQPVKVKLFGERPHESIVLPLYFQRAYTLAEEFCTALSSRVKGGGFFKTLLLRRIGSTMYAGQRTVEKLLNEWNTEADGELMASEDEDDTEILAADTMKDLTANEIRLLQQCLTALQSDRENDPKYQSVVDYLFDKGWLELGCIIFSQYYDSVWWLANQLSEHHIPDEQIAIYAGSNRSGLLINGQFKRMPRDEIKRMVRTGALRLVLGTDAASEGLNLQRLGTLINLDLPWNPTRLEQRKGRIQRIGQLREEVLLYNMRYRGSVEDRVHELLSERLEDIFELFGQVPDILEDAWVDIAMGDEQEAKRKIRSIPQRHPFDERYSQVADIDWDSCSKVLESGDRRKMLIGGW